MSNKFSLTVKVDDKSVKDLKNSKYQLCVSKEVNGRYTVVWKGTDFTNITSIEWTESYKTYGAVKFSSGVIVKPTTNEVPIEFGQTATLDEYGLMNPPNGGANGACFTVQNQWKPCHIGISQPIQVQGEEAEEYHPVWVNPLMSVGGTEKFTPAISLIVFFSRDLKTSSMFADAQTSVCAVTYAGTTTAQTIAYADSPGNPGSGLWVVNPHLPSMTAVAPRTYSIKDGFTPLPGTIDAFALASMVEAFRHKFDVEHQQSVSTCPVFATMVFKDENDAGAMQGQITYRNSIKDGWPADMVDTFVGPADRTGSTLKVRLDTSPGGGDSGPVIEKWARFCKDTLGNFQISSPISYA